jgi:cytochrome c oxidase subunit 3/cytochrome o ubiquinol oxidase subunit 3
MGQAEAHYTTTGLDHRKILMWVFLASDCLFFGALISTYMVYRSNVPVGPGPEELFDIPYTSVSAFVLLMSSLTMVLALAALQRGNSRQARLWLLATALQGTVFLGGQFYEFNLFVDQGLTITTSVFGTSFFVLTGFHGTHVAIGVFMLLTLVGASYMGRLKPKHDLTVELVGLYWHFVDIVWIVIFTVVYLIPS